MSMSLQAVLAKIPPPVLHRIGELQHRHPRLLPISQRLMGRFLGGDRVIAGGVGEGLRFDAAGGIAGYVVGTAELVVQQELQRLLRPGDVVYDVGASIGFITVICARLVGPTGRVIAFEPSPEAGRRLAQNVAINGFDNVTVIEAAAGAQAGNGWLVNAEAMVWGSLETDVGATTSGDPAVVITTIDEAAADLPAPNVVKMDIEGAEPDALRGMTGVLREHRPVVLCEIHDTFAEVRSVLVEHGYDVRELKGVGLSDDPRYGFVLATPPTVPAT
jgi:FkbM family methyltransferase